MKNILRLTLALTLSALTANNALAFTVNGTDSNIYGWKSKDLVFHLNPENCPGNIEALIDDALEIWNGVPTASITLSRGETTDSFAQVSTGQSSDVPAIFCSSDSSFEGDPNSIPGYATGFHTSDDRIDYGYLVLNLQPNGLANIERLSEQLVKSVIAHEVGHVLGLGHSATKDALMYYDATEKKTASLAQDDVDGLTYLYPRDELGRDQMLGCGVTGRGASGGGLGALGLMMLLMVPLGVVVRSRFAPSLTIPRTPRHNTSR